MRAGQLRNQVAIQQLAAGQDAIGQPVNTWSTLATVWADIRYRNGLETIQADATTSVAKASIRIRRRTDVTPGMRVLFGATAFNIVAVLPDEAGREYLDLAGEVVS